MSAILFSMSVDGMVNCVIICHLMHAFVMKKSFLDSFGSYFDPRDRMNMHKSINSLMHKLVFVTILKV